MLTPRQELLLRKVVEGFSATGQPVGDPLALEHLEVQFRGVGVPEAEIAILSEPGDDGSFTCHAEQNGKKIVKGGKAVLRNTDHS